MACLSRLETVGAIEANRISAIIRTEDQELARRAMTAAVDGGFRLVEFTMTTPGALELVAQFASDDRLVVGAGTVMSQAQVHAAVDAGARFIVSPIADKAVMAEAEKLGAATIPGASTPTEMEQAWRWGADFVKLFPEPAGGVDFVRAVRGPLPHLRIFPTAGPTPDNFLEYLDAGCAGVGFVRSLFVPGDLVARDFDAIAARASRIAKRLAEWSGV